MPPKKEKTTKKTKAEKTEAEKLAKRAQEILEDEPTEKVEEEEEDVEEPAVKEEPKKEVKKETKKEPEVEPEEDNTADEEPPKQVKTEEPRSESQKRVVGGLDHSQVPSQDEANEIGEMKVSECKTAQLIRYLAFRGKDDNKTLYGGSLDLLGRIQGNRRRPQRRPFNNYRNRDSGRDNRDGPQSRDSPNGFRPNFPRQQYDRSQQSNRGYRGNRGDRESNRGGRINFPPPPTMSEAELPRQMKKVEDDEE